MRQSEAMTDDASNGEPGRFFDSRAAYRMFITATNEKAVIAARVGEELEELRPRPPALRVLDAGMGDASVLTYVMRQLHAVFPHVPWLVVGKEISIEDVRLTLEQIPDRFLEHPEMAFAVTNMTYRELVSSPSGATGDVIWRPVALEGSTTQQFARQIRDLYPLLAEDWEVETDPRSGNPRHVRPAALVLYRADREFLLRQVIPQRFGTGVAYDLIIASQPYRARTPVERKVRLVIAPLARALAPGGRLIAVHSHGDDPGLEIVRAVWPDEDPLTTSRHDILAEARRQLDRPEDADLVMHDLPDERAILRYELHVMPSEVAEHIGTSSLFAAWNAAAYVAQVDEPRLSAAIASGAYQDATRAVLRRHGTVWFHDEVYVISRRPGPDVAAGA